MDSARSWFLKLQPRDKLRASTRKKEPSSSGEGVGVGGGGEGEGIDEANMDEEALSNVTKQKVAAAKQYIENHYKEQMKNLQERKERYGFLILCLNLLKYLSFLIFVNYIEKQGYFCKLL